MRSRYLILLLLFSACSAQKKAAEKEQQYIQKLQGKYITPGSSEVITIPGGMVNILIRDTIKGKDSIINITKPCPPIVLNLDSLVRKSKLFIHTLLEAQYANLNVKTLQTANDMLHESNNTLERQRNNCVKILLGVAAALAAYIFGRFKKII